MCGRVACVYDVALLLSGTKKMMLSTFSARVSAIPLVISDTCFWCESAISSAAVHHVRRAAVLCVGRLKFAAEKQKPNNRTVSNNRSLSGFWLRNVNRTLLL